VASLRSLSDDGSDRVVELRDRKLQIGRGRDNDIVLPDSQKGVSRTHAELRYENGRYVIVDLQSQNGTWLNGQRVERAEVPPDAEITVGEYRLRFQQGDSSGVSGSSTGHLQSDLSDLVMHERTKPLSEPVQAPGSPAKAARSFPVGVVGVALLILVGAVAWILMPGAQPAAKPTEPRASTADPASGGGAPPDAAPNPPMDPAAAVPVESAPASASAREPSAARTGSRPPRRPAPNPDRSAAEWSPSGLDVRGADMTRVQRKPGESTEQWRTRGAALHTRYAYSKQALDRGDFAAAAGGFEAILMEEPGFLDAPQLLVQANAGLRLSARDLYEAGNKLEAVGELIGALQKYEQARLIRSDVPGLMPAFRRVREKLHLEGAKAFTQARQLDASGRSAEAVKEYEKAFQWLPQDDPNREVARTRVDQLKRHD
jgi:hypothetical protein